MKKIGELLHPIYRDLFESGALDQAIAAAKKVLKSSEEDKDLTVFERATELGDGWFQLALLHELADQKELAREAAKKAYEHNLFNFDQHYYLVKILLEGEEEPLDKIAGTIANFDDYCIQSREIYHDVDSFNAIVELLEANRERSKEINWVLDDFELTPDCRAFFDGEYPLEGLMERPKRWREEGRDPNECDKAETIFLDFDNRLDDVLELWKTKDMSLIPDPTIFARTIIVHLRCGEELPQNLEVTKVSRDPYDYYEGAQELLEFSKFLETDKKQYTPKEKEWLVPRLERAQLMLLEQGYRLYEEFIDEGKPNSYTTSPRYYAEFVELYSRLLSEADNDEEAFRITLKACNLGDFPSLVVPTIRYGLNATKYDEIAPIVKWAREKWDDLAEDLNTLDRFIIDTAYLIIVAHDNESTFDTVLDKFVTYYNNYAEYFNLSDVYLTNFDAYQIPASLRPVYETSVTAAHLLKDFFSELNKRFPDDIEFDIISLFIGKGLVPKYSKDAHEISTLGDLKKQYKDYLETPSNPPRKPSSYRDLLVVLAIDALDYSGLLEMPIIENTITGGTLDDEVSRHTHKYSEEFITFATQLLEEGKELFESREEPVRETIFQAGSMRSELYYSLGLLAFRKEDYNKSFHLFEEALKERHPREKMSLDELYEFDFASASDFSRFPDFFAAAANYALGASLHMLGGVENNLRAISYLEKAWDIAPTFFQAFVFAGGLAAEFAEEDERFVDILPKLYPLLADFVMVLEDPEENPAAFEIFDYLNSLKESGVFEVDDFDEE